MIQFISKSLRQVNSIQMRLPKNTDDKKQTEIAMAEIVAVPQMSAVSPMVSAEGESQGSKKTKPVKISIHCYCIGSRRDFQRLLDIWFFFCTLIVLYSFRLRV